MVERPTNLKVGALKVPRVFSQDLFQILLSGGMSYSANYPLANSERCGPPHLEQTDHTYSY